MSDLLVRLYDLPGFAAEARLKAAGIDERGGIAPASSVLSARLRQRTKKMMIRISQIGTPRSHSASPRNMVLSSVG